MSKFESNSSIPKPVLTGLHKLGIYGAQGLILHLPIRYLDETHITPIRDLQLGEQAQVEGEITHAEVTYKPRKALIARLEDASGTLFLRFLNFYPSQVAALKEGKRIRALGESRHGFFGYEMVHPQTRAVSETTPVKQTLTPVYPTTAGLSQATLRKWIDWALQNGDLSDALEPNIYRDLGLPSFEKSLQFLHHPSPDIVLQTLEDRTHPCWRRLAFDELLAQQLSMRKHYAKRRENTAPILTYKGILAKRLLANLSFDLTKSQQKAAMEISIDLAQPHPMQRLLQGDVGSGKTIVAALAALQAVENGYQVALMAPTEILAEQHYHKMHAWFASLGLEIAWLTGSQSRTSRQVNLGGASSGAAQMVIGTHVLFQEHVSFAKLGLAIIDEQHRFGVQQRLALRKKGEPEPHQLMMSATPIPRTLSMSYYADLDVSTIDELPPGRTPIATKLVSDERRDEVLARVREACLAGSQAYWVCPLIEESEALQLQTAQDTFAHMQASFPDLKIALIHGRLKPAEKQAVMEAFARNEIQLLVATTVIEVGVDVPNASLMVIEHAERFGLSQLHQLRGRVGRGVTKSVCILMYSKKQFSETARARLKVIYENTDGFKIAQEDLNLRGPGEYLGTRQSGVPMLKIADLERDADLLQVAKELADGLIKEHPKAVDAHLERWISHAAELVKV